jgi:hypothetical protein
MCVHFLFMLRNRTVVDHHSIRIKDPNFLFFVAIVFAGI